MSEPDDLTRRLLAPRPRAAVPGAAPLPAVAARRWRWRWRIGATLALLAAAGAGARWLWPAATATAPPVAPPAAQQAVVAQVGAIPLANPAAAAAAPPLATAVAIAPPPAPAPPAQVRSAPSASLSELLQQPASAQLRWARFKGNPAIVVIEYPNLRDQGLAMNRLAAMFEKRATRREQVLSENELDALLRRSGDTIASFYQGHDYPASKLARFFSLAEAQRVALNAQELQLRTLLTEAGVLQRDAAGGFRPVGEQAAVSFTGIQADDPSTAPDEGVDTVRREAVLRHELSHGEFFANPAYREHCLKFWRSVLREPERRMWSNYLRGLDYNPDDEELMANETQALLMHTPDSRAFNAASLSIGEPALAQLRIRFRAGEPAHGVRGGEILSRR